MTRQLIELSAIIVFALITSQIMTIARAFAGSLQNAPLIFDVRRSLPLDPAEPVYHDFYINAGAEAGFKKGWIFNVVRVISVHDPIQNKQQGELQVNVARLQVLQVAPNMTVARLISEFTDEERPALDFESVMIGDRVDVSTLAAEPAKPAVKKKSKAAKVESENEAEVVAEARPAAEPPHTDSHVDSHVDSHATSNSSAAPVQSQPPQQAPAPLHAPENSPLTANPTSGSAPMVENTSPVAKSPDMVRVPVPPSSAAGKL